MRPIAAELLQYVYLDRGQPIRHGFCFIRIHFYAIQTTPRFRISSVQKSIICVHSNFTVFNRIGNVICIQYIEEWAENWALGNPLSDHLIFAINIIGQYPLLPVSEITLKPLNGTVIYT